MKKISLKTFLATAAIFVASSAWADNTTVGAEDNTGAWWSDFSTDYILSDNQKLYLEFTNYTSAYDAENWKDWFNWAIIVKNDEDGHSNVENGKYKEYFAMNSANNSWGEYSDNKNRYLQGYVWGQNNQARMNGATVKMTVTRENGRVSIYALMSNTTQEGDETSPSLKTWSESYFFDLPANAASENIRVFLTIEKAHLVIDNSKTSITTTTKNYYTVGTEANDALFFSAFSDYYSVAADQTLKLHFKNYSLKGGNYQNWIAVVTNSKERGADGYEEYLVLRNDNYGWGTKYASGTLTNDFEWGAGDATFRNEMDGSDVIISLTREGTKFTVNADITASDGTTKRFEKFEGTCNAEENLYFFLTTDHGHLSVQSHVTKTITAGWATLSSDYALDFTGTIDNLEAAYAITGNSGNTLTLTPINQIVAAGEGILLKGNGEVNIPIKGSGTAVSGNKLEGNLTETVKEANSIYVLMDETKGVGFYKNNKSFTVGANTAYLPAESMSGAAPAFLGFFDSETTGIESVKQNTAAFGDFFDMQGRRVAKPSKGLYIMNGKKVVIK